MLRCLVLALLLLVCAASPSAGAQSVIQGLVLDISNNYAIPGAQVLLLAEDRTVLAAAPTDAYTGRYSFTLPPGRYVVRATLDGWTFDPVEYLLTVEDDGKGLTLNFKGTPPVVAPKPVAPSSLRAMQVTGKSLTLKWKDLSSDETGFMVESGMDPTRMGPIGTVGANATSAKIKKLSPRTTYWFRVSSVNAQGGIAPSETIEVKTKK